MQNARLHEAQAEIKIAGRNINNFRYAEDTTLMSESEEELKSLLMKVKCISGSGYLILRAVVNTYHSYIPHKLWKQMFYLTFEP